MKLAYAAYLGLILAAAAPQAGAQPAEISNQAEAVTRPSKDVTLAFVRPGRVDKVLVKAGDRVTVGQVLVRLDDAADQAQLKQLQAEADDTIRIRAAEARTEQAKVDLKKMEEAAKKGAASPLEVDRARLDVVINELGLKLAEFDQTQAKLKAEEARLRLDQMVLKSSIDGTVRHIFVEDGQSVDALGDVVRVVQTVPLWVDAAVATPAVAPLRLGASVKVQRAADPPDAPGATARIIFIDPQADPASATRIVRLEVPNESSPPRPAGERVRVIFDPPARKEQ